MGILAQAFFYKIPLELMSLDVMRIAYTSLYFIMVFFVILGFSFYYFLFRKKKSRIYVRLMMVFIFIYFPAIAYYSTKGFNQIYALIFAAVVICIEIGVILRNKEHLANVFNGKSWHYQDESEVGIINVINRCRVFLLVFLFIVVFPGAFLTSYINCHNKVEYDVFIENDYFAIVNYSADNILAKKIKNHQLSNGYYIFKTDAMEGKKITKLNIQLIPEVAPSGSPASPARLASLR